MGSERLQLNIEWGAAPIISAYGELDCTNCSAFSAAIENILTDGHICLKLALRGLQFVDSSGLRVLLVAANEARQTGKSIIILSLTPQLGRMLRMSGFEHLFVLSAPIDDVHVIDTRLLTDGALSFESAASIDACRNIRNKIGEFASQIGFGAAALDDIKLAVGEAVSNAIRHGTCGGNTIFTKCRADSNKLIITIQYASPAFDPHAIPVPDSETCANGGMGIHFMKLVMDDVHYEFGNELATITLVKRIWQ